MAPFSLAHTRVVACSLALLAALVGAGARRRRRQGRRVLRDQDPAGAGREVPANATRARPRSPRAGSRSIAGPRFARAGPRGRPLCPATWMPACSIRRSRPPTGSSRCPPRASSPPRSSPTSASGSPWAHPTRAREQQTNAATPATAAKSRDWWSLKPLKMPSVPPVDPAMAAWAQNPIDAFILAKLEEKNLRARPRGRPPHVDPPALV